MSGIDNKRNDLISIIVPVYNTEEYIDRCINSILTQTYTNFELILVDDGSIDNSGKICDEYAKRDNRITVIHKENGGAASARNIGLDWVFENSDSEWITLVDSDDYSHTQMLEILKYYADVSESKLIVGDFIHFYNEKEINHSLPDISALTTKKMDPESFFVENVFIETVPWCKLYHRSCFNDTRYPNVPINEDNYITYKIIFDLDSILLVKYPIYFHYHNPNGLTNSEWNPEKITVFDAYIEQIDFFERNGFKRAKNKIVLNYANRIASFISEIKKSGKYNNNLKQMRKMMRNHLKKYKDVESISWKRSPWLYSIAYPNRFKAFHIIRASIVRVKRLFHMMEEL